MACYLLRLMNPQSVGSYASLGALFETHVINQIIAVSAGLPLAPQCYHWRTKTGAEVDLILERDGFFYPIEVICKSTITKQDLRGIKAFSATYSKQKINTGIIVYAGERCYWVDDQTIALPFNACMRS